jgi:aminoglycoside phosphotransferase (APT) family kinase protein
LDHSTAQTLSAALLHNLVLLHSVEYRAIGLADLGKPEGYTQRQVTGWISRYHQAQTDRLASLDRVGEWLANHTPLQVDSVLIHNDYKFDNLLLDPAYPGHIVAVLDWEMATLGCPLMDLGTTLGYWVEATDSAELRAAATGPTATPGCFTRRELADRYEEQTGRDISGILFYYVFGLFKIAVIVQQIYARYRRGHTQDARFAQLNLLVETLARQADRALNNGCL